MNVEVILKKVGLGIILSIIILSLIYVSGGYSTLSRFFLAGNMPYFNMPEAGDALMKYNEDEEAFNEDEMAWQQDYELAELVGIGDVVFWQEDDLQEQTQKGENVSPNLESLRNLEYLKKNYYIVDKKTAMSSDYFNVDKFSSENLKLSASQDGPKILLFHTHAHEMFLDSKAGDINEGIVGAGERLCQNLEKKGIKTIHITDSFDVVNGKSQITGAYERMEPKIRQVIHDNPSIEVVIDLHRDGVSENTHLLTTVNGKPTAQIMFFNGLCRLNQNGALNELTSLKNPYIPTNLAFSFALKRSADQMYPGFSRKIYLNAYRYSLHMMPRSTLIEVGAQTNTKQEIYNAIDLLSEVLYDVLA